MDINFYKLHVLKNDFLLADFRNNEYEAIRDDDSLLSKAAVSICDRRTGAGASGIVFIVSSGHEATSIKTFSSDGSSYFPLLDSTMVASRYIFDSISVAGRILKIVNNGTSMTVQMLDSRNCRLSAGFPSLSDSGSGSIIIDGMTYAFTTVSMSRNGIVFFPDNRTGDELKELTRKLQKSTLHGESVPVFVFTTSRNSIKIKNWAPLRQPDNLLVCGIAAVASSLNGYDNDILALFHQKASFVEWDRQSNEVFVTSSPEYAITGNYFFDENSGD